MHPRAFRGYDGKVRKLKVLAPVLCVCLAFWAGCGGSRPKDDAIDPDKAELIDVLTLFVEAVQADRYDKAFAYLTPGEKSRMLEAGDQPSPDVKRRLKALRLSTLAQKPGVRLQGGKVEGIFEQLPDLGPRVDPPAGASKDASEVPTFQ